MPKNGLERWWNRQTVRDLRTDALRGRDRPWAWDERDNDETRLPQGDSIHLGSIVIAEVFTPSNAARLVQALKDVPPAGERDRSELIASVEDGRGGERAGWTNLGPFRRPGEFVLGKGGHDSGVPNSVSAVWLHMNFVCPSATVLVATFSIEESQGDLSHVLRRDFVTRHHGFVIRIQGLLGGLRAQLPWARPRRFRTSSQISRPAEEKRLACEEITRPLVEECRDWLGARFPGRFASERIERQPIAKVYYTETASPRSDIGGPLTVLGFSSWSDLWRSVDPAGWLLSSGSRLQAKSEWISLAGERSDVKSDLGQGESSNFVLAQALSWQGPLMARLALLSLMRLYRRRMSLLRDRSRRPTLFRGAVSEARELDDYLVGDSLDLASIAADVQDLTADSERFVVDATDYRLVPGRLGHPEEVRLLVDLRELLMRLTEGLVRDAALLTPNIRASAELRQTVSNLRLQRAVLVLSVAATIVALIGLLRT